MVGWMDKQFDGWMNEWFDEQTDGIFFIIILYLPLFNQLNPIEITDIFGNRSLGLKATQHTCISLFKGQFVTQ